MGIDLKLIIKLYAISINFPFIINLVGTPAPSWTLVSDGEWAKGRLSLLSLLFLRSSEEIFEKLFITSSAINKYFKKTIL